MSKLRRRRPTDPGAAVDAIAAISERLAVLLAAGVPASSAWQHVSAGREAAPADALVLTAAAGAAAQGESVADAIAAARGAHPGASVAWPVLAAAWSVAAESGAPLAASLRNLAVVLRDEAQLRRDVGTALAGPAASARLVTALPVIALVFGATLGFDTVGVLLGNPIGVGCLVGGALLLWAGARWNRRLARAASVSQADAGLELELLAIAMSSGASIERARALVRETVRAHVPHSGDGRAVDEVVGLAARAGAPVAELLRAESFRVRRAARSAGAARAAALGVRLMLPLGLCVLPAFVLLGVAPLMISVVTGTLGGAS
ncbi:type II secretion system F family protein [Agromyces sp. NPDC058136]|uniref:type II secretion system F family protein n=1 Tax=Agromyces sp. NPDC058136 TaxID=3346354 RepID=UPI0036DCCC72